MRKLSGVLILVLGWVFVVGPLARSAAVWCKSFVLSFLPIRKVLVLPFAGGASPSLPVVSLLFSVSYPQARRSYYLFFNYLFFNYLYRVAGICGKIGGEVAGICGKPSGRGSRYMRGKPPWITGTCAKLRSG